MNPFTKSTLFLRWGMLLLVLSACAYPGTGTDPARIVNKTAVLIADFTPPSDYEPDFGLHTMGYTAVAYKNGSIGHLYLAQSEMEADGDALQQALGEMVPGYRYEEENLTVVEQRQVSIRNQAVTVTISEGMGWDNELLRQATAVFQGKAGPALLILQQPISQWDDAAVDAFLTSVR
ncbi:MAG: hypothetical protein H6667_03830 [Ardenticatenaceae bacterium]|nr:hypothetical protein [Ardenticatenaceae bacterium]